MRRLLTVVFSSLASILALLKRARGHGTVGQIWEDLHNEQVKDVDAGLAGIGAAYVHCVGQER
jgi:hypothetical protein